jgi:hypothetical protein
MNWKYKKDVLTLHLSHSFVPMTLRSRFVFLVILWSDHMTPPIVIISGGLPILWVCELNMVSTSSLIKHTESGYIVKLYLTMTIWKNKGRFINIWSDHRMTRNTKRERKVIGTKLWLKCRVSTSFLYFQFI